MDGERLWQQGRLASKTGKFHVALEKFEQASPLAPREPVIHLDWAWALDLLGQHKEALARIEKALDIKEDYADAHYLRGLLLLLLGEDYKAGWQEYKWLYRSPKLFKLFQFGFRLWDGCEKRNVGLLYSDQGIGDAIHFSRYIPDLKRYFKRLYFLGKEDIGSFLNSQYVFDKVITPSVLQNDYGNDPRTIGADRLIPFFLLPCRFQTFVKGKHPPAPSINVQADLVAKVSGHVQAGQFKIGIAWTGNPGTARHLVRSIPPQKFSKLQIQ